ncbi:MAG: DUF3014 domain-containing protein [Proteobacteria bacterium]|nr:DUF3014 domain-containing protein [Pseudomonadota bacterium]
MNRSTTPVVAAIAVVAALLAGWYGWQQAHAPQPVLTPVPPPVAAPAPLPAPPPIEHPIDEAPVASAAAPDADVTLDHSDAALRPALAAASATHALPSFFHADRIIRSIVATVDALPRGQVAVQVLPVDPVPGRLVVTPGDAPAIAPENATRYTPYVVALQQVDMKTAAGVYKRFYPFFQQAYRELGYPNGYFNDRVVQVIDVLLATPEPQGPVALQQPKVLYVYADPALEALPAGQKMLLRMGPDNAAIVKGKLRELRAQIVKGV